MMNIVLQWPNMLVVTGMPVRFRQLLYNCLVSVCDGYDLTILFYNLTIVIHIYNILTEVFSKLSLELYRASDARMKR